MTDAAGPQPDSPRDASPQDGFRSAAEVADRLGVSVHFVYRLVREGKIACHRFGRRVRFTAEQIDAYVASCRVPVRPSDAQVSSLVEKHLGL